MPDIAVVGASNRTSNDAAPTVQRVQANNSQLLIAAIALATGTITNVPAGWTLIDVTPVYNPLTTGDDLLYTYWRETTSGDPATWAFTASASGRWVTVSLQLSSAHLTTPVDVKSVNAEASGTAPTALGVDPTYTNDLLVYVAGWSSNTPVLTAPVDFTIPTFGQAHAAAAVSAAVATKLLSSGAATGNLDGSLDVAAASGIQLLAIANATPASDAGSATVSVGTAAASGTSTTATDGGTNVTATVSVGSAAAAGTLTGATDLTPVSTVEPRSRWWYRRSTGVVGRKAG